MFPFHRSCDLSFQVSHDLEEKSTNYTNTNHYPQKVDQQHAVSTASSAHNGQLMNDNLMNKSPNTRKGRPRKSIISSQINSNHNNNPQDEISENDSVAKKRVIHREIERQRRQDMSNLYSSLRSLLPLEYIKGKRSICDHITEATRYIKDLEKNVKELGEKRDQLKGLSTSSSENRLSGEGGCWSANTLKSHCNVNIHGFPNAIEIDIGFGLEDEDVFPLSRVLQVLIEEGLHVVTSVSSAVDHRRTYVIHCEVNDVTSIDLHQLQQRLTCEISSYI